MQMVERFDKKLDMAGHKLGVDAATEIGLFLCVNIKP
jgi:hypothetical protein